MSDEVVSAARARLVVALQDARAARKGVPEALELQVRSFARESREAGVPIAQLLIDMKGLVRDHMGADEPLFTPKVIGWTVSGYFAGTGRERA